MRLEAAPICDADLPHHSQISDAEDYRFQLPVAVYGNEQQYHGGGKSYSWGNVAVHHRYGVRFRLVNVGASRLVREGMLGYPVCGVCGQSRSPFASNRELQAFRDEHLERCGRRVENIGFFADVTADSLQFQGCRDRTEAYSLCEALRRGAAEVLEMELDDLQVLAIGRPGDESPDIVLYDPMPGGSGLLDQMVERWREVVIAARKVVDDCTSDCSSACVDCLLHYRNAHYHRHLDRKCAGERLGELGEQLKLSHDIPARLPGKVHEGETTNPPEEVLRHMLERAGFSGLKCQHPIDLSKPLGVTTPDFFFE